MWKDEYIVRVYELARAGMSQAQIIQVLGCSKQTFITWKDRKPALREAFRRGVLYRKGQHAEGFSFRNYVYNQLSAAAKATWDEIMVFERTANRREKIDAIFAKRGVRMRQHLFLYAWTSSNFKFTAALRRVCISSWTFNHWKKTDPEFARLVAEIEQHKKDFFEEHLCSLVAGGDSAATIFANRTYNRDRGYGEHVDVGVTGQINHAVYPIDSLDLPLEARSQILESLRRKRIESRTVESEHEEKENALSKTDT